MTGVDRGRADLMAVVPTFKTRGCLRINPIYRVLLVLLVIEYDVPGLVPTPHGTLEFYEEEASIFYQPVPMPRHRLYASSSELPRGFSPVYRTREGPPSYSLRFQLRISRGLEARDVGRRGRPRHHQP